MANDFSVAFQTLKTFETKTEVLKINLMEEKKVHKNNQWLT